MTKGSPKVGRVSSNSALGSRSISPCSWPLSVKSGVGINSTLLHSVVGVRDCFVTGLVLPFCRGLQGVGSDLKTLHIAFSSLLWSAFTVIIAPFVAGNFMAMWGVETIAPSWFRVLRPINTL